MSDALTLGKNMLVWFLLGSVADGQDMRGACVSCGDILKKCEMTCLLRPSLSGVAQAKRALEPGADLSSCLLTCKQERESCTEATSALICLACMQNCSTKYVAEMQNCLQLVDVTTEMTFNKNIDACAVSASSEMDTCSEECYGSNNFFYGWSPQTEEGRGANQPRVNFSRNMNHSRSVADADDGKQLLLLARPWGEGSTSEHTLPGPWYLRLSGIVGIAMVFAGAVLEHIALPRCHAHWRMKSEVFQ